MSRFIYRTIKVGCTREGTPGQIYIHNVYWTVEQILDRWADTGCWWESESEKIFYRLCCNKGKVYEVFQDLSSREWFLYKSYD